MVDQDSASKKEGQAGDVRAFDVHTGKLRWTFRLIPRPGETGIETWDDDSWSYTGAGNIWAPMSADDGPPRHLRPFYKYSFSDGQQGSLPAYPQPSSSAPTTSMVCSASSTTPQ